MTESTGISVVGAEFFSCKTILQFRKAIVKFWMLTINFLDLGAILEVPQGWD